jgi:hypothetical protein
MTLFTDSSFSHGQGRIEVARALAPPDGKFETGRRRSRRRPWRLMEANEQALNSRN